MIAHRIRFMIRNKSIVPAIQQLIIGFLAYVATLAGSLFLSQKMGVILFGDYSVAIALMSIVTSIVLLGTDTAANRFIPSLYKEHKNYQIIQYFSWNMRLIKRTFQACLLVIGCLVLLGIIFHLTHYINVTSYHLALYSLLLTPILALSLLISSYMISFQQVLIGTVYKSLMIHVLILFYFVAAVYLFHAQLTSNSIILLVLTLSFFSLLFLELLTARRRVFHLINALRRGIDDISHETAKVWYKTSLHLIGAQMIYITLRYVDLFIVKIFSPHPSSAGIYSAIMVITHIIYFIPISITFLVKPAISSFFDKPERYSDLQEIIDATNAVIFISCPTLLLIICYWNHEILAFFGPDYIKASSTLIIFSIGCTLIGLSRVPRAVLVFSGKETTIFYVALFDILILLIIGIPATYFFDLIGMAMVVACLFLFQGSMFVILAKHYLPGIKPLSFI